jgi:hypothetical protein
LCANEIFETKVEFFIRENKFGTLTLCLFSPKGRFLGFGGAQPTNKQAKWWAYKKPPPQVPSGTPSEGGATDSNCRL